MTNDYLKKFANSRREFVRQTSLLAGGLIAAPILSKANYFSGADDTIKIVLIGCGGRGTGAATQALSTTQNVKLVAMADAFQDNVEKCYATLTKESTTTSSSAGKGVTNKIDVPAERRFFGFDAYLKAIPLADVVILAAPPGFRPIHFEEAIKQNKHVLMEKPLATDRAGIQKV